MNPRVTVGLLVVLAALLGVLAYSNQAQETAQPTPTDQEDLDIFSFSFSEVQRLDVRQDGRSQTFAQSGEGEWTVLPAGQAANQRVIETVLLELTESPALRRISAEEADPSVYGLGSPRLIAEIHTSDGATHSVKIGAQSPVQTGYYAQTSESGDVLLLPSFVVAQLELLARQPLAPTPMPTPPGSPAAGG